MGRWDYLVLRIEYDKKQKNWALQTDDGLLVGLQAILDARGAEGWELVSLNPDSLQAAPGFGKYYIDTATYRAVFKRPA